MSENDAATLVRDFQTKFEIPDDPVLWTNLVKEEFKELAEAAEHLLKEAADVAYVANGLINIVGIDEADRLLEEQGIGPGIPPLLNDLIDVFIAHGVSDEAFLRVHKSNLSKLGDDGKPLRREDGKVLKGPNYQPPVLTDLIISKEA